MLVGGGILEDGADVHAALVREGAVADVGLVVAQRQVGQFGDETGGGGQVRKVLRADGGVAQLEFEVGDDGGQVGVPAAFAIAVHAALHVRDALLDGGDGVGDGDVGIVVAMDPQHAVETLADLGDDLGQPSGQGAAVGIAEAEDVGAGGLGRFEGPQGEGRVGAVAVEEVLGVVDDLLAVVLDIADGFGDEDEVLVVGDAEGAFDVEVPGLAEDGDDGVPASTRARTLGSRSTGFLAKRVEPKAVSRACLSLRSLARAKNSLSLGLEPGQPPSM